MSRAFAAARVLLAAGGLCLFHGGCAPTGDADRPAHSAPAAQPARAFPDRLGDPDRIPGGETPRPPVNESVPVLGTGSLIGTRGFDTRARQGRKSSREIMEEYERQFEQQRYPDALKTLEAALRDQPNDPALLYLMAVTYRAAGDASQAAATLERVNALDPQHLSARKLLCIIWTEAGRCVEAEAQISALIEAGTADADAWALRSAARLWCGDLTGAAADAERSLEIDPGTYKALLIRSALAIRAGRLDAARDDLVAARTSGAPEASWMPLSEELARRVAAQKRASESAPAP